MRETVRSLRLYFGFSALYGIAAGIARLLRTDIVAGTISLCFGLAYLYLSILLPKLLKDSLQTIKWILIAASVVLSLALLSSLVLGNLPLAGICALGLAINWYLFRNAKRLAGDNQASQVAAELPS